jgi:hypothetical protein
MVRVHDVVADLEVDVDWRFEFDVGDGRVIDYLCCCLWNWSLLSS